MWIEKYPSEDLLTQLVCILKLIMAQNHEYQHNIQLKTLVFHNTLRLCILRKSMLLPEVDLTIRRNLSSFFIDYLHYSRNNNCSDQILLKIYRIPRFLIQIKGWIQTNLMGDHFCLRFVLSSLSEDPFSGLSPFGGFQSTYGTDINHLNS